MPTPEELAAAEAAAKAAKEDAGAARLADLEAKLEAERQGRQTLELRLAKEKVLAAYPSVKDFEDLVTGKTPDEILTSAKTLSEKFAARDAAALKIKEDELKQKWGQVPGGSPIGMPMTQSRMDEYENAKKIPDLRTRLSTMFRMKMDDLHARTRSALQALVR